MQNARLDESQVGIKTARRNTNNLRCADNTTLVAENEDKLKRLLIRVDKESEKAGFNLSNLKTKKMAYGPINSWQIEVENVEAVTDFIFWSSKTITDGDCRHETKRCLFLVRKAMTNLDNVLKSRDRHHFASKSPCSQSCGFYQ